MNIPRKLVVVTLGFVLAWQAGCERTYPPGNGNTPRDRYTVLSVEEELAKFGLNSQVSPDELAEILASIPNGVGEGKPSKQTKIYPIKNKTIKEPNSTHTVVYTYIGFSDDSIAGSETRFDFTQSEQGQWQVNWVGERTACWRGNRAWAPPGKYCS
ncbi:MAG: hypothetical protein AAFX01_12880 [Cyanobacteria bacterium J06638_28]